MGEYGCDDSLCVMVARSLSKIVKTNFFFFNTIIIYIFCQTVCCQTTVSNGVLSNGVQVSNGLFEPTVDTVFVQILRLQPLPTSTFGIAQGMVPVLWE